MGKLDIDSYILMVVIFVYCMELFLPHKIIRALFFLINCKIPNLLIVFRTLREEKHTYKFSQSNGKKFKGNQIDTCPSHDFSTSYSRNILPCSLYLNRSCPSLTAYTGCRSDQAIMPCPVSSGFQENLSWIFLGNTYL